MIQRFSREGVLETATRRRVSAGHLTQDAVAQPMVSTDADDVEAYRKGYAEGFEAGEKDGLQEASQRMQMLEDAAQDRLHELTDERNRLAALVHGLNDELARHHQDAQALAFELALESLSRVLGHSEEDGSILQRLCADVAREFRAKAVQIAVSPRDRAAMPDDIDGLAVTTEAELAPGHCRILTGRGYVESSIGLRLASVYAAMLQSLGIETA